MELRQLRSLITLVETNFSVSQAAAKLFLVQSAVSQHITRLEDELGIQVVVRLGKRITGLTPAGEQIYRYALNTLSSAQSILDISVEQREQNSGILRIGATHTQARYILPPIIKAFNELYPHVELQLHQSTPIELMNMLLRDQLDIAIYTEHVMNHDELIVHPMYQWNRSLITLPTHPLCEQKTLQLKDLCDYPLITYVHGFTGRGHFDEVLKKAELSAQIVLSAADTDVIKTYVAEGMGIGIIASVANDDIESLGLCYHDLSSLFPWETTKIAYKKDKFIRAYQTHFIELFHATIRESSEQMHVRVCE
ncbi:MAG: LysR family transcriptional regulator [Gammaproteobacteria bacterium]|nr:LysR family transcriptional regulator [Gammaproteobacteria bacterium]